MEFNGVLLNLRSARTKENIGHEQSVSALHFCQRHKYLH